MTLEKQYVKRAITLETLRVAIGGLNFYFLRMTIWLFALVLLGLSALIGYAQGGIRVGISFLGLLLSAALAIPLSPLIKPLLPVFGWKHPLWAPILPPVVVFILLMIIFKVVAQAMHSKVSSFYKYKTDDKTCIKWERLNHRLGMSLGFVHGATYFILILVPIYVAGYFTTQVASGAQDPARIRFINQTREQMHASKVDKVVAAYDPASKDYYEASDIAGLLKNNPLLISRLARYPVFLSISERKEFQDLANDIELHNMIQSQAKTLDILNHASMQTIVTNPVTAAEISQLVRPDLKDLHGYLLTAKSEKYDDEKILGYWTVDINATVDQEKVANPKITPFEKQRLKQTKYALIRGVTFVATTDGKAILKNKPPGVGTSTTVLSEGTWKSVGSSYEVTFGGKILPVTFENGQLVVPNSEMTFVFEKEM